MFRKFAVCTAVLVAVLSNEALSLQQGGSFTPTTGGNQDDSPGGDTGRYYSIPGDHSGYAGLDSGSHYAVSGDGGPCGYACFHSGHYHADDTLNAFDSVDPFNAFGFSRFGLQPELPHRGNQEPSCYPCRYDTDPSGNSGCYHTYVDSADPAETPAVTTPTSTKGPVVTPAATTSTDVESSASKADDSASTTQESSSDNIEQTAQQANTQSGNENNDGTSTSTIGLALVGTVAAVAAVGVAAAQVKKARDADAALETPGDSENIHIEIKRTPAGGSTIL
ncbi:hypothetical protein GN244_ATG19711 [Phytophthora infestans]|uniref:Carbohydrate-binding protein n=1 Tax=Phytophthora infestans TaxID=4787 RepID=A0A833WCQ8_PHYIN|nr:hypothetical protein GN244_ATG19711 [Phytophthora infestans]